jgi:hypothetical protein
MAKLVCVFIWILLASMTRFIVFPTFRGHLCEFTPEMDISDKEKAARSRQIDKYLKEEKIQFDQLKKEPKLLILGSSDSGKSTLLKQLKILHGNGFSDEEKGIAINQIRHGVVKSLAILFRKLDANAATKALQAKIIEFEEIGLGNMPKLAVQYPPDIVDALCEGWQLTSIKRIYSEFDLGLPDTAD